MAEPIWTRQPGEPLRWFGRFERYRLSWPHSIPEAYRDEWREEQGKSGKKWEGNTADEEPTVPKKPPSNWYDMATQWDWQERVAAWDQAVTTTLEELHKIERARTLVEGFAPMHRRIQVLSAKAAQLLAETEKEQRVWLPDAKLVGEERVNVVRFNTGLFEQIRGLLSDIAAEMGERVKKKELAITDLPANVYGFDPDQDGVDREPDTPPEQDGAPC